MSKGASLQVLCDYPGQEMALFNKASAKVPDYFSSTGLPGVSPLIRVIQCRDFDLAKMLIRDCNANINFADAEKMTPIMHAVRVVSAGWRLGLEVMLRRVFPGK